MGLEQDIDVPKVQSKGNEMIKNLRTLIILLSAVTICFFPGHSAKSRPRFEQSILLTSAGQSADVQIAGVLAKRAGLTATLSKNATQQDLGDKKTLALVIGVSMKGLGAAGLDLDLEKTRVRELIEEAQKKGIPLLCLHLGGKARIRITRNLHRLADYSFPSAGKVFPSNEGSPAIWLPLMLSFQDSVNFTPIFPFNWITSPLPKRSNGPQSAPFSDLKNKLKSRFYLYLGLTERL